jgi:lipid II:glycine glycyltransferase (peptidoglycan interpeptide bridge formation enzyme)
MPLLLWNVIRTAKSEGCLDLDLGRCDLDDGGLVRFKENWGAKRSALRYFRYTAFPAFKMHYISSLKFIKTIVSCTPPTLLKCAGNLLYRHMG